MSQMNFDKKSGWKKFFTGKGFYLALAVCLVAVCGVAVATFMDALPQSDPGSSQDSSTTAPPTPTTARPVDKPVTNVPDDRTTATTTTKPTYKPADKPVDTKPADLFVLPLSNEVLLPFSEEPVFSQTMQDWRTHSGTDFKGELGQDVKAVADGTVTKVETDPLWGAVIEIEHGLNIVSRYCGATAKGLTIGQNVTVGEVIGTLSEIPCEILDEAHLHLEILTEGKPVDPVQTIKVDVRS